ncbi:protein FAM49B-like protein [Dinothrombium tinctorium]|uniref:Protein FAM49B-like protein n=1 Tax=Dinothrombium tinctorium TaxID=1965070 RepID=A0A443RCU4_9ACAR|nr:protein FAM49B-like protein [Dinothrombium tinctorium]
MGNLLRLLSKSHESNQGSNDIFVDFENAQPTGSERETYAIVQKALIEAKDILFDLQTYKGAGNEIREAIGNPRNDALQIKAWETVVPLVNKLAKFYSFSVKLESVLPQLLICLCSGPMTPWQHLETQQALVKQFAELLDFVLKFDDLKMTNPSIQNDFSYYRRTINRLKLEPNELTVEQELPNELANRMSLFYANATPMLKAISDITTNFVRNNKDLPIEQTTETLSTMAKVCQRMVENPEFSKRFQNEDTILFVLRVMVGVIILYDHVHPMGAFVKSSHIDIKGSIKVLKEQPSNVVEGLINALRYTTKHLSDETTPKHVKSLLS